MSSTGTWNDGRFWVAVVAAILASLSLGWQAATHVLTGGRIKVWLKIGAMNSRGLLTGDPSAMRDDWFTELAVQGYQQPIAAVRVANVGRQPVTIQRWGLECPLGVSMYPVAESIGPTLPHRL